MTDVRRSRLASHDNYAGEITWFLDDEDETEIIVAFTMTVFDPGVRIGPAEFCYPPEGGEVEILGVWRKAGRTDASRIELTQAEEYRLIIHIQENPPQVDDGYDG
jgi:hypothetical protein